MALGKFEQEIYNRNDYDYKEDEDDKVENEWNIDENKTYITICGFSLEYINRNDSILTLFFFGV